jgi:hypothetical protein
MLLDKRPRVMHDRKPAPRENHIKRALTAHSLTTILSIMARSGLVVLLIILWLALNGLEPLSNVGFDTYRQTHRSATAYLAMLEGANERADDTKGGTFTVQSWPCGGSRPNICISSHSSRKETILLKEALKIYKLHDVFLI